MVQLLWSPQRTDLRGQPPSCHSKCELMKVPVLTRKLESTRRVEIPRSLTFLLSFVTSNSYSDLKLISSNYPP
jgi:hypothetical protein